jgi:Tol biopolymer transport system component
MKNLKNTPIYLSLILLLTFVASPAHATFPGKNGRIAFVQGPDIFTMKPDGSDVRQLTSFTDGSAGRWVNWSADSAQLVFTVFSPPDFLGQLWLMNADGSGQHPLLDDPGASDEAPTFSPDGSQVIFERCGSQDGPCSIYRVGTDGNGLTQVTPWRTDLSDFEPAYSPDGSTIAFWSFERDGVIGAVYSMNPDGSGITRLSDPGIEGFAPSWSPDGRQLAFTTNCCSSELSNIAVMMRDRRQQRQITQDNGTMSAGRSSWSPEGDAIVFRNFNVSTGDGGIFVIKADGTGLRMIQKGRPPALLANHGPTVHPGIRQFRNNKKGAPVTEIEEGGSFPRWGSAQ